MNGTSRIDPIMDGSNCVQSSKIKLKTNKTSGLNKTNYRGKIRSNMIERDLKQTNIRAYYSTSSHSTAEAKPNQGDSLWIDHEEGRWRSQLKLEEESS